MAEIVVTANRLYDPILGIAWAGGEVPGSDLFPEADSLPDDPEGPMLCETVLITDEEGVDQAKMNRFNANKAAIAEAISRLDNDFQATTFVAGNAYPMRIFSSHFYSYLANYDFAWNSQANTEYGDGASFDGAAIVNPMLLNNGDFTPDQVTNSFPNSGGNFGVAIWNWVTIHEAAHQYVRHFGIETALWEAYLNAGGDPDNGLAWSRSSGFSTIEKITNDLVRAIASAANLILPETLRGGEGAVAITSAARDPSAQEPSGPDGIENESCG
jgi:hypothetical protein